MDCIECMDCANYKPKSQRRKLVELDGVTVKGGVSFWESSDVSGAVCISIGDGKYIRIHPDGTWEKR